MAPPPQDGSDSTKRGRGRPTGAKTQHHAPGKKAGRKPTAETFGAPAPGHQDPFQIAALPQIAALQSSHDGGGGPGGIATAAAAELRPDRPSSGGTATACQPETQPETALASPAAPPPPPTDDGVEEHKSSEGCDSR
jgi:hypothetical protein